ncbi:MAG: uroporphyrinogen decarboxylase family protein [Candidatus Asgardarchaeia archaeon]
MQDYRHLFVSHFENRKPLIEPFLFHQTATLEFMQKSNSFWPEAHKNPELMARLAMAPVKYSCFNNYVVPFGLTAEAEALGAKVKYGTESIPPTVNEGVALSDLRIPDSTDVYPLDIIKKAIEIIREADTTRPIVDSMCGPFTALSQAIGISETMHLLMKSPDVLKEKLEDVTRFVIDLNNSLLEIGGDILLLLEPVSTLLGPNYFKEFSAPFIKRVVDNVKAPTILHMCGNATLMLETIAELGPNGFSFDHNTDLRKAVEILKGRVLLVGNLDPVSILWQGTPEVIEQKTIEMLENGIDVPAPGCGLSVGTPIRNLNAFCNAVTKYKELRE